jgi:hypothetical protein
MAGSINRRPAAHTSVGKKGDISEVTRAKRARGMAQVIEHLPCKHEALSSYFNIAKNYKSVFLTHGFNQF